MDKYYYFIAQLPTLFFRKEPEITIERFMNEAGKWLDPADFKTLASLTLESVSINRRDPGGLKQYKNFENALRSDIAAYREARQKDMEYKPSSFPLSAIREGNPLEIELRFMEFRWKFLDEMEPAHHFDFTYVVIYFLKLLLLQRYFSFEKEKGLQKFQMLYHEVRA
ncbi:MAG: DUF2764 family protein [Deltaproteobacteria bacterium]|nr:DUF2764 family protein [Deltaproteobacteria bacterium]